MNDRMRLYHLLPTDSEYGRLLTELGAEMGARWLVRGGANADGLPRGYLNHADPSDRECLLIRSAVDGIRKSSPPRLSGGHPNHYRALALPFSASNEAITFSFRYLSRSYHPDTIDPSFPIVRRFKDTQVEICQAKSLLLNAPARACYDQTLLRSRCNSSLPGRRWFFCEGIYQELKERIPPSIVRTANSPRVETPGFQPRQQIIAGVNTHRQ